MKVLFVTREYPPFEVGGVATHTFQLVTSLKNLGVSCRVISFGKPEVSTPEITFIRPISSVISKANCSVAMDSKIPLDIVWLSKNANKLIKNENFNLIHIQEPYVGAFVRHKRKVTTIHDTSHGEVISLLHDKINAPNIKRMIFYLSLGVFLEVMSAASSNTVITTSTQVQLDLIQTYRVPKDKIKVIRNGVNIPKLTDFHIKTIAKNKLNLPSDKLLIFSASQHVARKRLDLLLKSISILKQHQTDGYKVVIAGDGPLKNYLSELAKKFGIEDIVQLPGWVSKEELTLFRQATDIFVMTSDYEAGPISLLEAMSFGNSVVSTNIDGFPSMMVQNVDGLLFDSGDYVTLSNHLLKLLKDSDLRERLSKASISFARRFEWSDVAKETLDIYKNLLALK
jgi:glycosyltransferase involved in cell wall biosynthesis